MFELFWDNFLYRPLINVLFWIYNNWTNANLGWTIVYMTVLLRIVLLPFTLVSEKNRANNEALVRDVKAIQKNNLMDSVTKKEEIRKLMKLRKVQPWAKAVVLAAQALVLILLYQVFIGGITGEKVFKFLYSEVEKPIAINTIFYGFDLGATHSTIWAGAVALFLFTEIYVDYKMLKFKIKKTDLAYFFLFPLLVFGVLWILPMAKSLFVLTSLLFSVIIHQFTKIMFKPEQKANNLK